MSKHKVHYVKELYKWLGKITAYPFKYLPITPNMITSSRLFIMAYAAILIQDLTFTNKIITIFCLLLFSVFDVMDGSVARLKDQKSFWGAWLDPQTDRLGFFILFTSISYLFYTTNPLVSFLSYYCLSMFFIIKMLLIDLNNKEKFNKIKQLLPTSTTNTTSNIKTQPSFFKKLLSNIRKAVSFVVAQTLPHAHNVVIYFCIGIALNKIEETIYILSIYLTIWYIKENSRVYSLSRKADQAI